MANISKGLQNDECKLIQLITTQIVFVNTHVTNIGTMCLNASTTLHDAYLLIGKTLAQQSLMPVMDH